MKKDFYDVLGVKRNASESDIRKAYRRLARKFHPDVNPGNKQAEERFKEISEAYQVLNDPEKRKTYDQFGHTPFSQGPGGSHQAQNPFSGFDFSSFSGNGGGSFGDFFRDMFSRDEYPGGQPEPQPSQGEDLHASIEISFEDAFQGISTEITIPGYERCGACSGTGSQRASHPGICPECRGTGQKTIQRGMVAMKQRCPKCSGTGRSASTACSACHGSGSVARSRRVTVKIPAGVDSGSKIRLAGQGKPGQNGSPPGDLYITTKVRPHALFRRNGNTVLLDVPITIGEALLGARIAIPLVVGSGKLTIPPSTSSEQTFRLPGKGFPDLKGGKPGDLMVIVHIVTPDRLSEASKNLIREYERLNPQNPREAFHGNN